MNLYLNDLSMEGRFLSNETALQAILGLFFEARKHSFRVVVSRSLVGRSAVGALSLHGVIASARQTERALLFNWLGKSGPFSEDEYIDVEDNLWWHENEEVTDQGLGAAGRGLLAGETVASFSFPGGCDGSFNKTPLEVVQGFPEEPIWIAETQNYWTLDGLVILAEALTPEPGTWDDFISECVKRFNSLNIDQTNFNAGLKKHPFSGNVVRRGLVLLDVLNRVAAGIQDNGSLSEAAMELVTQHFQGGKAWFSDEDPEDKNVFMFRDGNGDGSKLYCSWHGKIKTPQFRVHFQWPVPDGQRTIKVLYFGEKLTKW